MKSFRFLHASDIHLDSPLTGLGGTEQSTIERIRTAPRAAFESLVDHAINDELDFAVIAGDLYDGSWRDFGTGLFFADQMGRLNTARIPVFVLHGNHDAQSQITRPLRLPENVQIFGSRNVETIYVKEHEVALHGQSYPERAVTLNLVPKYPAPLEDVFNIGVLHTALGGSPLHARYAPCTVQELVAKGYDYWALGHIHRREIVHERPYVVFSGNIQGRHIRETGPKGATLVTVENGEVERLEELILDVVRWSLIDVDVTSAEDVPAIVDMIHQSIAEQIESAAGRLVAARIVLHGKTDLHNQLLTDIEHLTADVQSVALGLGDEVAWVEKILVETESRTNPDEFLKRNDSLGVLQRMLLDAKTDKELMQQIASNVGTLVGKLPSAIRDNCEDAALLAAVNDDYGTLVDIVTPYLLARLLAEDQ